MEFDLSDEQAMLQDSVHRFLLDAGGLERTRAFAAKAETRATDLADGLAQLGVTGLLIGEEHGGSGLSSLEAASPGLISDLIDAGRVMYAADTLGAAQEMLDRSVAYAAERKQFGRPIGSFQAVKHMCAEMAAALEPCRALVWYAGYALDALPAEASLTACHAKAHLSEVGTMVARTATEVHGGMGFTDLVGLHYWFKRIGFNRQMLGGPQRVREEAAKLALAQAS